MATTVTIVNPDPGALPLTLNGKDIGTIDGTLGGTTFHTLDASFEERNTLVSSYAMGLRCEFNIDVPQGGDGLQLFVFQGIAVLIDTDVGEVLAQAQGDCQSA